MDVNEHVVFFLVQERLAEARAAAARARLAPPPAQSPGARYALGAALIRMGRLIAGERLDLALPHKRSPTL